MATKTLSASLDPVVYRAAQRVAKEERRPQSAVVAEALRLYTALPLDTRQMLLSLELKLGAQRVAGAVGSAIRSAALQARFDAVAGGLPAADVREQDVDALADEAVSWARRPGRG